MRNILYISYGSGLHEHEAVFSLLSARHKMKQPAEDLRILVFTDHPENFSGVPATVEYVAPGQWLEWSGPTFFNHRRKILALRLALKEYSTPTVLLDADTWFRKSPLQLFDRISPGKTLMHIREARISEIATPHGQKLAEFLTRESFIDSCGRPLSIPVDTFLWNAGVIGMDPADAPLLDDVLHLTDEFCARSNLHILEQLAFSYVLERRSHLFESQDIVFHYWPPYLHEPFKKKLPELIRKCSGLSLNERIQRYYPDRPRPTLPRRAKVVLKRCLQTLGFLPGRSRSNEW